MAKNPRNLKHVTLFGALALCLPALGCGTATDEPGQAKEALTTQPSAAVGAASTETPRSGPERRLQRFDADGDGVVEVSELPPRPRKRLAGADADRDGKLTADEMKAAVAAHVEERFRESDSDGDGKLTQTEVGAWRWKHLAAADTDGDHALTLAEMNSAHERGVLGPPRGRPGPGARRGKHGGCPMAGPGGRGDGSGMFDRFDTNQDGKLTRDEAPEFAWQHIAAADTDSDGAVTREELKTAKAQGTVAPRGGGFRGGPPGRR